MVRKAFVFLCLAVIGIVTVVYASDTRTEVLYFDESNHLIGSADFNCNDSYNYNGQTSNNSYTFVSPCDPVWQGEQQANWCTSQAGGVWEYICYDSGGQTTCANKCIIY